MCQSPGTAVRWRLDDSPGRRIRLRSSSAEPPQGSPRTALRLAAAIPAGPTALHRVTRARRPGACASIRPSTRSTQPATSRSPSHPAETSSSPAASDDGANGTSWSCTQSAARPGGTREGSSTCCRPTTTGRRRQQAPERPEEQAAAIVFLASDAASNVNGVVLPVDDGWSPVRRSTDPRARRTATHARSPRVARRRATRPPTSAVRPPVAAAPRAQRPGIRGGHRSDARRERTAPPFRLRASLVPHVALAGFGGLVGPGVRTLLNLRAP